MWRMIYDVLRFNASTRRLIGRWGSGQDWEDISIGEYLKRNGYSEAFSDNYLIPMTAAIWSTPPDKCALDFPARTLIQFMHNHHLLQITGKPSWLTIPGGRQPSIRQHHTLEPLTLTTSSVNTRRLFIITWVRNTSRDDYLLTVMLKDFTSTVGDGAAHPKVTLTTASGETEEFDHVILACHSDTALKILRAGQGVTEEEERILGLFQWNKNESVLHHDEELMPRSRLAWSCWNYLTYSEVDVKGKRKANCPVNGMNALQHISEKKYGPVLVTLNPPFQPAPEKTIGRYQYDHPVLDANAVRAQSLITSIQGRRSISYAGAYLKYGFHEDGFTSGLLAATKYAPALQASGQGPRLPFQIMYPEGEERGMDGPDGQTYVSIRGSCGTYHGSGPGGVGVLILALLFDLFEVSGARDLVGFGFRVLLMVLRISLRIVGIAVNLDG
ncbi:hypothetical protein AAF712_015081 [Marasmius tenuissimus]|uniref:Uncharacterized protein n=1 Tax=Marasmius tenuissimus TaxID=585030 RepID=A0ABR2ZCP9_9AGAR